VTSEPLDEAHKEGRVVDDRERVTETVLERLPLVDGERVIEEVEHTDSVGLKDGEVVEEEERDNDVEAVKVTERQAVGETEAEPLPKSDSVGEGEEQGVGVLECDEEGLEVEECDELAQVEDVGE